ncbi:MAG TPA: pilus assembly protein TadG-related protein [Nocardioidaceae bacterium]|nr:pilus assembly protein TadG-related protein [Nocardioidaceae bacterium]
MTKRPVRLVVDGGRPTRSGRPMNECRIALTGRRGSRLGEERGQTAVLIIGFALVIAMAVVVVVDASAAFLRRQALNSLADGAALSAADGLQGEQVYAGGLDDRASVDPRAARALVQTYLSSVGAGRRYPGLSHSVTTDAERVVVRVAAPLDLPLPLPGVDRTARVGATAAAVIAISP